MVKLMDIVHARGRISSGEPRDFKVSPLQDGYGKHAVAYVEDSDGQVSALLVGGAEYLMDPCVIDHSSDYTANPKQLSAAAERPRTRGNDKGRPASRKSIRIDTSRASLPYRDVRISLNLYQAQAAVPAYGMRKGMTCVGLQWWS